MLMAFIALSQTTSIAPPNASDTSLVTEFKNQFRKAPVILFGNVYDKQPCHANDPLEFMDEATCHDLVIKPFCFYKPFGNKDNSGNLLIQDVHQHEIGIPNDALFTIHDVKGPLQGIEYRLPCPAPPPHQLTLGQARVFLLSASGYANDENPYSVLMSHHTLSNDCYGAPEWSESLHTMLHQYLSTTNTSLNGSEQSIPSCFNYFRNSSTETTIQNGTVTTTPMANASRPSDKDQSITNDALQSIQCNGILCIAWMIIFMMISNIIMN